MNDSDELRYFTYDEAVATIDGLAARLGEDYQPAMWTATLEQTNAAVRDHLIAVGCDPTDKLQLRAAMTAALMSTSLQMQVTPVGAYCVVLLAALRSSEAAVRSAEFTDQWGEIVTKLSASTRRASRRDVVARFMHWLRT